MRIIHALLALTLLWAVARAQDDLGLENLVWEASVKDLAPFALEFVRTFDHKPVLVRGFESPVKRFFAEAKLEDVGPGLLQMTLRDAPWREEVDGRARNVLIVISEVGKASSPQAVVAFADLEGGSGLDENPISITHELEIALIRALDKRFPRVTP